MKSAILKRSIELNGHKTSVSLENEFWDGLRKIVDLKKQTIPELLKEIDAMRGNANLSSAIRVFVLDYYRTEAAKHTAQGGAAEPLSPVFPPPRVDFPR